MSLLTISKLDVENTVKTLSIVPELSNAFLWFVNFILTDFLTAIQVVYSVHDFFPK